MFAMRGCLDLIGGVKMVIEAHKVCRVRRTVSEIRIVVVEGEILK